jgi:L-fucose mutarotase
MLRFPLIHPPLLAALAACGHGGKVLLADANYSHSTDVHPGATTIYLNLRPGLLTVHQVLEPLLQAVPVEAADVMTPGDGTEPDVFTVYRELLGPNVPLRSSPNQAVQPPSTRKPVIMIHGSRASGAASPLS